MGTEVESAWKTTIQSSLLIAVVCVLICAVLYVLYVSFVANGVERFASSKAIAYLSTGALDRQHGDILLAQTAVTTDLVPLNMNDIVFVKVDQYSARRLANIVEDLYRSGVRYFLGGLTSGEILQLAPFLNTHKDVVLVSTASTADVRKETTSHDDIPWDNQLFARRSTPVIKGFPFLDTYKDTVVTRTASTADTRERSDGSIKGMMPNLYRFVPNDARAAPLFADTIVRNTPANKSSYAILYNSSIVYSAQMRDLLAAELTKLGKATKSYNLNTDHFYAETAAKVATAARADNSTMILLVDDPDEAFVLIAMAKLPDVFVSDSLAFYHFAPKQMATLESLRVKSFTSWVLHEETYAFGHSVYRRPVSPFLSNVLAALWYVSDMYHSGTTTMSKVHVEKQKLFDSQGDCALNHTVLAGVKDGQWTVMSGAMENPYLPRFRY